MKIVKLLFSITIIAVTIYFGIFILWFALFVGCVQHQEITGGYYGDCGRNLLTQTIRTTHAPLLGLMFGNY